jgi:hypothetical protein
MITRNRLLCLLAALAIGVGAYAASVATRPASPDVQADDDATKVLMDWLNVPAQQRAEISAHDPHFAAALRSLRATLAQKRADLAASLDDPNAPDEAIRAKLEALLAADANLERRVADYLLSVRHYLTADQQRKLFGLCAEGVRQGPNCPWRMGADGSPGRGRGMGMGRGASGGGGGFGPGPGGRGFGRGQNQN